MKVKPEMRAHCATVPCDKEVEEVWPCVYLQDIPANLMKGLEVGSEVSITLKGRIKSISSREDYKDKDEVCINIDLEYKDVTIKKGGKNEWEELA